MNNSEPMLSTYLHTKGAKLGLPIGGTFEITSRCNFDCPMCYVHSSQNDKACIKNELSAEQWISIAKQAKDRGMVFALLTGGEPFIRKDFFEIYNAMRAMGLIVSINTNGSLLDGQIRQKLIENPPFRVNISLYGSNDDTYKNMCGRGVFDKVIENIRAVNNAGIDVRINLSVTPYNKQDLKQIYEISQELGVHIKASSYMYPPVRIENDKFNSLDRLSAEEAAECSIYWDKLRLTQEEFNNRAEALKNMTLKEDRECSLELDEGVCCRAGSSTFWMTWDGKMLPCGMFPSPVAYPLVDGFEKAWEATKSATKKIKMPKECVTCPKRDMCFVCAAVCVTETGAYDKVPEYVCRHMDCKINLALNNASKENT